MKQKSLGQVQQKFEIGETSRTRQKEATTLKKGIAKNEPSDQPE